MAPVEFIERAVAAGLDRIAITDHNAIDGALEAHGRDPDRVIVGEEITCRGGTHLIGLFLSHRIPAGLPVEETAERIRDQDGVVYAPHPYAYAIRSQQHAGRALAVADMVEVFNSRAFLPHWNRRAAAAADTRALPMAAGTDAHFSWELGRAYTEMPAFQTVGEFRNAIGDARPVGLATASPWIHVASRILVEARRMTGERTRPAAPDRTLEGART
jgi:predicted metal-dependent phosphoesterase TrpH